jgi:hypothetical protein
MSMALSARRVPSHFQHRIGTLVPSTSATWRLSLTDGIVVLLDQALELLIQEHQRVLGQRRAHPLSHCAIFLFARDEVDHSSGS